MLALAALLTAVQKPAIDPLLAARYFFHAKVLADRDHGKLWGITLAGPIFFADRASHQIVANTSDPKGVLTKHGEVFVGKLPDNINISNTGIDWSGQRWTMIGWPLSDLPYTRGRLLMHESFHRIQPQLGFHILDLPSGHLDDLNGRMWMRLEMRALSEALIRTGRKRSEAITDALLFRHLRQKLCGDAATQSERQLELNEGLAEYTGYKLCGLPPDALPSRVASRLDQEQSGDAFSRSFCYATGPAYGLLLDDAMPAWRKSAVQGKALDVLLLEAAKISLPADLESASRAAADKYDGDRVIPDETVRDNVHQQRVAEFKKKFVEGPFLYFSPGEQFGFGFDPNAVDSFPPFGSVYNGARVSDMWGVLESTTDVLFVRTNGLITEVRVALKGISETPPQSGDGWTLKLNAGWSLKPGTRKGDWTLVKNSP
jgi:hypothetical protein